MDKNLPRFYTIAKDGMPRAEEDLWKWAEWMTSPDTETLRVVDETRLPTGVVVRTFFLGTDGINGGQMWRTEISGGADDETYVASPDRKTALVRHYEIVGLQKGAEESEPKS